MSWGDKLPKQRERRKEPWTTNERIWEEWLRHIQKRGAKNTQRNLRTYARVFFNSSDVIVTERNAEDIEAFVARIETKCSKLMYGRKPQCLAKESIEACPLLSGVGAYTSCPSYQPLLPSATWSYVCITHRLYEWLRNEGRVTLNPVAGVMGDFASRHEGFFDERRRKPKRRILTIEEVRAMIRGSPIQHAVAYMLMAKCFLRIHEVLKLSFAPTHCNLDEGWMDLPPDWELGGKRMGNARIILDAELLDWIRRYLGWWQDRVKRDADGNPMTDRVIITQFGMPWGKAATHNFNTALHQHCTDLGIMTGDETSREERVNTHCFRAFATTYARSKGASIADVQIMRGDLSPGAIIRYDDYLARLPSLYRAYAPKLDL